MIEKIVEIWRKATRPFRSYRTMETQLNIAIESLNKIAGYANVDDQFENLFVDCSITAQRAIKNIQKEGLKWL
jgi:hypothetical protein